MWGDSRRRPACCSDEQARDLQVTLAESVRWLVEHGHISGRQAGKLATELDDQLLPVGISKLVSGRRRWTGR
jgi:hypothetical protein